MPATRLNLNQIKGLEDTETLKETLEELLGRIKKLEEDVEKLKEGPQWKSKEW